MESFIFKHSILDFILTQEVTIDHIGFVGLIATVLFIVLFLAFIVAYASDDQGVLIALAIIFAVSLLAAFLFVFNIYVVIPAVLAFVAGMKIEIDGWKDFKEDWVMNPIIKVKNLLIKKENLGAYQK